MNTKMRMLAAAVLVAIAPLAAAQVTTATTTEPNKGQVLVATKIASNFTNLAGSEENALALVNALRKGTDATLTTTTAGTGGAPGTTTQNTITVPTKPMGWGNVKHALALAQDQLARAGITNPTAAQLQTALNGGTLTVTNADGTTTTTTVKGILTMRADGMGWGNIAKEGGTKLGHVDKVDMSAKGVKGTTTTTASTPTKSGVTTAAGGSATGPSKGVTTAAGASGSQGSKGVVTAGGNSGSHGNAYGKGIVTGAGGSAGSVSAATHGKPAHAGGGAGVVTAGGNPAGSGVTSGNNAGGQGKGQGGDHGKGKGG